MVLTLVMQIQVGYAVYLMPYKSEDSTDNAGIWAQRYWFYIEMYFFLSICISYMFFFMYRSCTKHKLYPEDFQGLKSWAPDTETVIALERLEVPFLNAFCPCFMTAMILITPNNAHDDHKADLMI